MFIGDDALTPDLDALIICFVDYLIYTAFFLLFHSVNPFSLVMISFPI